MKFFLTCEHGGNVIPSQYLILFKDAEPALHSHRGYDPGALDLFKILLPLADSTAFSEISRLLVELNRSLHHPKLFSEYSSILAGEEKKEVLNSFYFPYRNVVEREMSEVLLQGGKALHLSVHTFTPELDGKLRTADIGLLFDPKREGEKKFCLQFRKYLLEENPELRVRFNYPYLGTADGFPTYLRKVFKGGYFGIELEVNQKFSVDNKMDKDLGQAIFKALNKALESGM